MYTEYNINGGKTIQLNLTVYNTNEFILALVSYDDHDDDVNGRGKSVRCQAFFFLYLFYNSQWQGKCGDDCFRDKSFITTPTKERKRK